MATVTTMGYKLPATGDRGSVFYPALEFNISRVDQHAHDGTDGVKIDPKDLDKTTSTISSAGWAAVAGQAGTYSQTVTVPTGYAVNTAEMKFYIDGSPDDGALIYPSVVKASSTTYTIYVNDNTITLKVVYG